jgi:hypothetical protein
MTSASTAPDDDELRFQALPPAVEPPEDDDRPARHRSDDEPDIG